jgi:DNA-binding NarL/FixJ family response regulator
MESWTKNMPVRILIVSSHPLFGQGLRRLLQRRGDPPVLVVGTVDSIGAAIEFLDLQSVDLIVLDYDDVKINREEFLARFIQGQQHLRIVLFSLLEGGSQAVVYDRRTMAASQIDDWLRD